MAPDVVLRHIMSDVTVSHIRCDFLQCISRYNRQQKPRVCVSEILTPAKMAQISTQILNWHKSASAPLLGRLGWCTDIYRAPHATVGTGRSLA